MMGVKMSARISSLLILGACASAPAGHPSGPVPDDLPDPLPGSTMAAERAAWAHQGPRSGPAAQGDRPPDERTAAAAPARAERTAAAAPARADRTADPATPGDRWSGRIVRAGHASARFQFAIPAGLAPLRGVAPPSSPSEKLEFASAGPEGVGIADGAHIALNSIVVFSDPDGLGVDFAHLDRDRRQEIAAQYGDLLRSRFAGASPARIVTLRRHLALRIELPRVEMPDRPVRRGRHYLIFDDGATASVDCLWTAVEAARMAQACDAIASQLQRVPPGQ